jgi:hypothetical protein
MGRTRKESERRPTKKRKTDSADEDSAVQDIAETVTSKVLAELQKAGILPQRASAPRDEASPQLEAASTAEEQDRSFQLPASALAACSSSEHDSQDSYRPLGRPLHTKVSVKLKEKICANEFIEMADILDPPSDLEFIDFHLAVKNKGRVGLSSGKKRKFLTIEAWTDAFCIFASVLRHFNKSNVTLHEDLAIYMDLIRSLQKDGGDWYHYDTTFRKAKQADSSMSWRQIDQVLYSRALMKKLGGPQNAQGSSGFPRKQSFRPYCYRFNDGKPCSADCKFPHVCGTCYKNHPKSQCWKHDRTGHNKKQSHSRFSTSDKKE